MAQDAAPGAGTGVMDAQVLVAEPEAPAADDPPAEQPLTGKLRTEDLVAGDLLVEEISIDGMCGVY